MAYGTNRRQVNCGSCGHPVMAHIGGGCHCGCGRAASFTLSRPVKRSPAAPGRQKPAAEHLAHFIRLNMSEADAGRFLALIATARGEPHDPTEPAWRAIKWFFIDHVSAADTNRYLEVLKRRKQDRLPLVKR